MELTRRLDRLRAHLLTEVCTVQVISVLSIVTSLATIITYLLLLGDWQSWDLLADYVLHWMVDNNLDVTATRTVVAGLRVISANSEVVMFTFLLLSTIHITASVSLYCSVSPCRTKLFLPWLISHMFIILTLTSVFICWTFITFFIDLLVSIVFPILSGLVLGVCILLWRLVFTIYRSQRSREAEKIKLFS